MTSHICQRVNTGESYIFYFGIFICCGPLTGYLLRVLAFLLSYSLHKDYKLLTNDIALIYVFSLCKL